MTDSQTNEASLGASRIALSSDATTIQLAPGVKPENVLLESGPVTSTTGFLSGSTTWVWHVRLLDTGETFSVPVTYTWSRSGSSVVLPWGRWEVGAGGGAPGAIPFDGSQFSNSVLPPGGIKFADGSNWTSAFMAEQLHQASHAGVTVLGSPGDDLLVGDGRAHVFSPGVGKDTIVGSSANEKFIVEGDEVRLGGASGFDTLTGYFWGDATVVMGPGVTSGQIHVERSGTNGADAYVTWGTGDGLYLTSAVGQINRSSVSGGLVFGDGSRMGMAQVLEKYLQAPGADPAFTQPAPDQYYLWQPRQGSAVIDMGVWNKVKLGSDDIAIELFSEVRERDFYSVQVSETVKGVRLRNRLTGETLEMVEAASTSPNPPADYRNDFLRGDQVVLAFADGRVLNGQQLASLAASQMNQPVNGVIIGTDLSDTLFGTRADEVIAAGRGDDHFMLDFGLAGHDTLQFNVGDGQDTVDVHEQDGFTLRFGASILSEDVTVDEDGTVGINGLRDKVLGSTPSRIEFADGTTWDAAVIARIQAGGFGADRPFVGTAGADVLVGTRGDDLIQGLNGNDTLMSSAGRDTLMGGAGADVLTVYQGEAVLEGGLGGDTLNVSPGSVVVFNQGDGRDSVIASGAYTLRLGQGIVAAEVSFIFDAASSGPMLRGQIQIGAEAHGDAISGVLPSQIEFADGSVLRAIDILAIYYQGTSGDDSITGDSGANVLTGQAGRDILHGGGGDDTLIGGEGADIYQFYQGGGRDVIRADNLDVLALFDIQSTDIVIGKADASRPDALVLGIKGSEDSITIDNASQALAMGLNFNNTSTTVAELLALRDKPVGVNLTGTSKSETLTGTQGDDTLSGLGGNDKLQGGWGHDSLIGGKGNDTYLFARGDGQDTIVDKDGTWFNSDKLKVDGANSRQLWLTREGSDLLISVIGTQDSVRVDDWYASWTNRVETISAGDGKTLTSGRVDALVSAMAAFSPPAMGETTLPANVDSALNKVLASSWR